MYHFLWYVPCFTDLHIAVCTVISLELSTESPLHGNWVNFVVTHARHRLIYLLPAPSMPYFPLLIIIKAVVIQRWPNRQCYSPSTALKRSFLRCSQKRHFSKSLYVVWLMARLFAQWIGLKSLIGATLPTNHRFHSCYLIHSWHRRRLCSLHDRPAKHTAEH